MRILFLVLLVACIAVTARGAQFKHVHEFADNLRAYGSQLASAADLIMLQVDETITTNAEVESESASSSRTVERAWHKRANSLFGGLDALSGSFGSRANRELAEELQHDAPLVDEAGIPHMDNGAIDTHSLLAELHQRTRLVQAPTAAERMVGNADLYEQLKAKEAELAKVENSAKDAMKQQQIIAHMSPEEKQERDARHAQRVIRTALYTNPNVDLHPSELQAEIDKRKLKLLWEKEGIPFDDPDKIMSAIIGSRKIRAALRQHAIEKAEMQQLEDQGKTCEQRQADAAEKCAKQQSEQILTIAAQTQAQIAGLPGADAIASDAVNSVAAQAAQAAQSADTVTGAPTSADKIASEGQVQAPASPNGNDRSLLINVSPGTSPEAIADLTNSLKKNNFDPFSTIPGRAVKEIAPKEWTIAELVDPLGTRCPNACNKHGVCVMNLNKTEISTGGLTVHPYMCLCDEGWVGEACLIKVDMYLRNLLTDGAAPYPKCCKVCPSQLKAPMKYNDIPTFLNPFSKISEGCRPYPEFASNSKGADSIRTRRFANNKCVQPLSTFEPVVALELATTLSQAQNIMNGAELTEALATDPANRTPEQVNSLRGFAARLQHAGQTAEQAANRLINRFAEGMGITPQDKAAVLDLDLFHEEMKNLPSTNDCCLFCDAEIVKPAKVEERNPRRVYAGPDSIFNQPPSHDTLAQEVQRNWAARRRAKRHAQLRGTTPEDNQPCCVVCPFNFFEGMAAEEIEAHRRKASKAEMDAVFLETGVEAEYPRVRSGTPVPCCPACPSQFLVGHAFPKGLPNGNPAIPVPAVPVIGDEETSQQPKMSDLPVQNDQQSAANTPPIPAAPVVEAF